MSFSKLPFTIDYSWSNWRHSVINMKKGFITAGTILTLLFSFPFASTVLIKHQASDVIYGKVENIPKKNVALVLGAAAYPTRLSDVLQDRVDSAIELYSAKKVTKLIMTGASNEVDGMAKYALDKGVRANDIIKDPKGLNTFASIQNSKNVKEMVIVTQNFHLPRAIFIAKHFDINAVGYSADKRAYIKIFDFKKREVLAVSKAMVDVLFSLSSRT